MIDPLAACDRAVAGSFGDRVVTAVLGGSVAAGRARPGASDLDLMVVLPQDAVADPVPRMRFTAAYVDLCRTAGLRPDLDWPAEVMGAADLAAALDGAGTTLVDGRLRPVDGEENSYRYWVSQAAFGIPVRHARVAAGYRRRAWTLMLGILLDDPSLRGAVTLDRLTADRSWWTRWGCSDPDLTRHRLALHTAVGDLSDEGLLRPAGENRWLVRADAVAAWSRRRLAVAARTPVPLLEEHWKLFRATARA